jgi:hypothetical protein
MQVVGAGWGYEGWPVFERYELAVPKRGPRNEVLRPVRGARRLRMSRVTPFDGRTTGPAIKALAACPREDLPAWAGEYGLPGTRPWAPQADGDEVHRVSDSARLLGQCWQLVEALAREDTTADRFQQILDVLPPGPDAGTQVSHPLAVPTDARDERLRSRHLAIGALGVAISPALNRLLVVDAAQTLDGQRIGMRPYIVARGPLAAGFLWALERMSVSITAPAESEYHWRQPRTCARPGCGASFEPKRRDQVYCSRSCGKRTRYVRSLKAHA